MATWVLPPSNTPGSATQLEVPNLVVDRHCYSPPSLFFFFFSARPLARESAKDEPLEFRHFPLAFGATVQRHAAPSDPSGV